MVISIKNLFFINSIISISELKGILNKSIIVTSTHHIFNGFK